VRVAAEEVAQTVGVRAGQRARLAQQLGLPGDTLLGHDEDGSAALAGRLHARLPVGAVRAP